MDSKLRIIVGNCETHCKGNAIAAITAIQEALKQPASTYTSIKRKNIYCDWYGNQEEAQAAVEAVKKA